MDLHDLEIKELLHRYISEHAKINNLYNEKKLEKQVLIIHFNYNVDNFKIIYCSEILFRENEKYREKINEIEDGQKSVSINEEKINIECDSY